MNGLDTTITGFIEGSITLDELRDRLEDAMQTNVDIDQQLLDYLHELFSRSDLQQDSLEQLTQLVESTRQQMTPQQDEDATLVAPATLLSDEDATVLAVHGDSEETVVSATTRESNLPPGEIGPGAVLKQRFRLENRLGEGGMGVVYKAVDLLKIEARDRNPYVAIKVLTESFKQHGDSFIALQREASKAQRLAHPNIATVFDFDRDAGTVFMTMELLEGVPLNTYIRQLPEGGLPEEEAMVIIEQLSAGLAYAHREGLVHSDFKPGNAFITNEGKVKVLDFGIARAAKHSDDVADANSGDEDKTVFDPTSLGALTPAYATVEMFEGIEPDPRDDIYALACVAYELLSGRHPFNKLSAPRARDEGLDVPLLTKINKRQMRALQKALAFERDERTATVEEFLHGIRRHKNYTKRIAFGSLVAILAMGAIAYKPATTYFNNREAQRIVLEIQKGDPGVIAKTLSQFDQFDDEQRNLVTIGARDQLLTYFTGLINGAVDPQNGKIDFPTAEATLTQAKKLYPDSAVLKDIEGQLMTNKSTLLASLGEQYSQALSANALLPLKDQNDVTDSLDKIQRIDPANALLSDPRLTIAYASATEQQIAASDYTKADELLKTAERYIKGDEHLTDLHDKVKGELAAIAYANQLNQQQQNLLSLAMATTLDAVRPQMELISLISSHTDNNATALRALDTLRQNSDTELNNLIAHRELDRAETLLSQFAAVLPTEVVIMQRTRLNAAWSANGQTPRPLPAKTQFSELAAVANPDETQQRDLLHAYRRELAAANSDKARDDIVDKGRSYYTSRIDQLLTQHRFTETRYTIAQSQLFNLPFQFRETISGKVTDAEHDYQVELQKKAQRAALEGQKQMFTAQTQSNSIREARATLAQLQQKLPADDPFLTKDAPTLLSAAYGRQAEALANRSEWNGAMENIDEALRLSPSDELQGARKAYRKPWLVQHITKLVLAGGDNTNEVARKLLHELKNDYGDEYEQLTEKPIESLTKKIKSTEATSLRQAHTLKDNALTLFDNDPRLQAIPLKVLPKDSVAALRGTKQMEQGMLSAAKISLNEALQKEASHEDVQMFKAALEQHFNDAKTKYSQFEKNYSDGQYESARKNINAAVTLWKDNSDFARSKARFDFLMDKMAAGTKLCRDSFGGYGNNSRATCVDAVGGNKGPLLVVVPAIGRNPTPFAMTKYEISNGDYNLYCSHSKHCSPLKVSDASKPVTGLKPAQVEKYIQWLSHESGFTYRLPARAEWKFAASAGGREGNSDYNCLLRIGTQTIKGQDLVAVSLGQPNRWGLVNYVGNAEEYVKDGDNYGLAGGSYRDSMSNCSTSTLHQWSGDASVAGFRLVRAME